MAWILPVVMRTSIVSVKVETSLSGSEERANELSSLCKTSSPSMETASSWGEEDQCRGVVLGPRKQAAGFSQLVTRIIVPAGGGEVSR